jgi:hypothetical protein
MSVISGPIAPYSNPEIEPQFYKPRVYVISNVSLGSTTIVTTDEDHDYEIGQLVRLLIPSAYGCNELNGTQSYVIDIPSSNQVTLALYSTGGNPFFASTYYMVPYIMAIGEINTGVINPQGPVNLGTAIPGSFINISPN